MLSDDWLMSSIADIISSICLLPRFTSSIAFTTRPAASFACSAFSLVFSAISSIDAVISSIALACSVEPCASAWLALATWLELMVTCVPASLILLKVRRLSSTNFFKECPKMSSRDFGFTEMVRLPLETSSATVAWYLILSMTWRYLSTKSPNSSLLYFTISTFTWPFAISSAASESCRTDFSMILTSADATNMVTPMDITATTTVNIVAFLT